jgi:hypothetical protein
MPGLRDTMLEYFNRGWGAIWRRPERRDNQL